MLTKEQRQQLLDYLALKGSDTVLLEAYHSAKREFDEAIISLTNLHNANRPPTRFTPPPADAVQVPVNITANFPPLVDVLPKKLGATGQACIAALKRSGKPENLAWVAKQANVSINVAKPQIALAIERKLIKQVLPNIFEAIK